MAKLYHVDLTTEERIELERIVNKLKVTSSSSKRSKILLAADRCGEQRWTDSVIASTYQVSVRSIERLRERYVNDGLAIALSGKPRLNLDKKVFDGEIEAKLVALRCSQPKQGHSGWTLRLLAEKMVELTYVESISHESVRQLLKKTKLSPGESQNG